MARYMKAILGGFLAILAAFGWLSAILTLLAMKGTDFVVGIHTPKWISLGIIVLMIFPAGRDQGPAFGVTGPCS